jgi:hypothetical protein
VKTSSGLFIISDGRWGVLYDHGMAGNDVVTLY